MTLHEPGSVPMPPADAPPEAFGAYWLSVAEDTYQARRYEESNAAGLIASGHFQRAAMGTVTRAADLVDRFTTGVRRGPAREAVDPATDPIGRAASRPATSFG